MVNYLETDDFFQCRRLLKHITPLEVFFSSEGRPAFQARNITELKIMDGRWMMVLSFFNFLGAGGWLNATSRFPKKFLDLFHHRFVEYFYQSFERTHFYVNLEQGHQDVMLNTLRALCAQWNLPDTTLFYAGHFTSRQRSAWGLAMILADQLELPVEIQPFAGHWQVLPPATHFRLSQASNILGQDTWLGPRFWDLAERFTIVIGPVSDEHLSLCLPGRPLAKWLAFWIKLYLREVFSYQVIFKVNTETLPRYYLGQERYLGWNLWLPTLTLPSPASGRGDKKLILCASPLPFMGEGRVRATDSVRFPSPVYGRGQGEGN